MNIAVGDIVMLKSGSPKMTVESIDDGCAKCVWFDEMNVRFGVGFGETKKMPRASFYVNTLMKLEKPKEYSAEKVIELRSLDEELPRITLDEELPKPKKCSDKNRGRRIITNYL